MPLFFSRAQGIELTHHHRYMRKKDRHGGGTTEGVLRKKKALQLEECEGPFLEDRALALEVGVDWEC